MRELPNGDFLPVEGGGTLGRLHFGSWSVGNDVVADSVSGGPTAVGVLGGVA